MTPNEITAERTYIGHDGTSRRVARILDMGGRKLALVGHRGFLLDDFARWADRAAGELVEIPGAALAPAKKQKGGRGLHQKAGELNGAEKRRAAELDAQKRVGSIRNFWFQSYKLKLANGAWYTPDFVVELLDGHLVVEEVKGHWEEAALVRIKVAASLYPHDFVALRRRAKYGDTGGWSRRVFKERAPVSGGDA